MGSKYFKTDRQERLPNISSKKLQDYATNHVFRSVFHVSTQEPTHLVEDLEIPAQVLVEREHRRHVAAAVAVVRGAPDRSHRLTSKVVLKPFHYEL